MMGNSGSKPYVPPPPVEQPFEDSIAARTEAARLSAEKSSRASRIAGDLNQETMDNAEAMTRQQIAKAETLRPQPQPHGPAVKKPRAPGSVHGVAGSSVLTG